MALLTLENVHTYYGAIHALKGISLHVDEGETVAVIGGNGAGKTTSLMTICGIQPAKTGTIPSRWLCGSSSSGSEVCWGFSPGAPFWR